MMMMKTLLKSYLTTVTLCVIVILSVLLLINSHQNKVECLIIRQTYVPGFIYYEVSLKKESSYPHQKMTRTKYYFDVRELGKEEVSTIAVDSIAFFSHKQGERIVLPPNYKSITTEIH